MRVESIVASDFLFKLWWNEAQSGIFAPLSSTQMAKYPKTNKGGAGSESAPKWKNLDAPLWTASHHPIQCFFFLLRPGLFTGKRDWNPGGFSWWSLFKKNEEEKKNLHSWATAAQKRKRCQTFALLLAHKEPVWRCTLKCTMLPARRSSADEGSSCKWKKWPAHVKFY